MTRTNARPQQGGWLAPLAVCLAAGAGLGCLSFVKWGGGPDLAAYLEKMAYGGRFRLFFSLLFRQLAYLVPLFLCGYFRRGLGAAALLFGVKGFFARLWGKRVCGFDGGLFFAIFLQRLLYAAAGLPHDEAVRRPANHSPRPAAVFASAGRPVL